MALKAGPPAAGRTSRRTWAAGRVPEQDGRVGDPERRGPVDGRDDVPLADAEHGFRQGRASLRVLRIGAVDAFDAVASGLLVPGEAGAEGPGGDAVGPLPQVPAADEGVQGRELADEVGDEVVELGPVADPLDERAVAFHEPVVIDVVEVAVVEIVPLHAPGVDEHLPPLRARIDGKGPLRKIDLPLGQGRRGRLGRTGVDDEQVLAPAHEELLAVQGQLEVPDVLDEGPGLDALVLDLHGLELGPSRGPAFPVNEEQGLVVGDEAGIDAGRERDLEDPVLEARRVDDDLDRGSLGVLARRRRRAGVPGLLRFGLQFVGGGEREDVLAGEAQGIDPGRLVEVGLGLARPPGAADDALEIAVGQEIEPFPVAAPGRRIGVDAVVGQRGDVPGLDVEEHDRREAVVGGLNIGQPAAVGGPGEVAEHAVGGKSDLPQGLLFEVEEPELLVLVAEGQAAAVGGRQAVIPQDLGSGRQALGRAGPVGRGAVEFPLAALVGQDHQGLAVREESGAADPYALLSRDAHPAAVPGRGREDVASRDEHDPIARGRDAGRCQVIEGLRDPAFPHLVEIGRQNDVDPPVAPGGDVVDMEIRDELIDDPAVLEGRRARVEFLVECQLLEAFSARVHGPQVHDPVAVAHEIDPPVPGQGVLACPCVVRGQGRRFAPRPELPEALDRSALVALGVAALEREAREKSVLPDGSYEPSAAWSRGMTVSRPEAGSSETSRVLGRVEYFWVA
jgi:hypothetical protein